MRWLTRWSVQRDVDALLGRRRRIDRPGLGIDGPPAFSIAVDHPALNVMNTGVFERFFRRAKDDRLAARPQNRRPCDRAPVEQNHAVASSAIRHGGEL